MACYDLLPMLASGRGLVRCTHEKPHLIRFGQRNYSGLGKNYSLGYNNFIEFVTVIR